MNSEQLNEILKLHKLYLGNKEGCRANLSNADLSHTNLTGVNLSEANLSGANLYEAKLSGADLSEANLSGANLYEAKLYQANLSGANLTGAIGIIPSSILLANWGIVSAELCKKLMAYDAQNHPEPELFNVWKKTGKCPYTNCKVSRSCNFKEDRELWSPELLNYPVISPYNLMLSLFNEKNITWNVN